MRRDESYSAFNPEFSWDNHNIRLTARDSNDLMSVTNERGNLLLGLSIFSSGKYNYLFTNYVSSMSKIDYTYEYIFTNYVEWYRPSSHYYTALFTDFVNQQRVINYSYSGLFTNYVEKLTPADHFYTALFINFIPQKQYI